MQPPMLETERDVTHFDKLWIMLIMLGVDGNMNKVGSEEELKTVQMTIKPVPRMSR